MREYYWVEAESRWEALLSVLRAFTATLCFAVDEPSSKRVGAVGLTRKPPKLRQWRSTQPRATEATASVAVVGKIYIDTARSCHRMIHAASGRMLGMRHADLRRAAAAVKAAMPTLALFCYTGVWYLV